MKVEEFISKLKYIARVCKNDGNWTYSQKAKNTFSAERKADRSFNCVQYVMYALRMMKIIPMSGGFYLSNGNIIYTGTLSQKRAMKRAIQKHFRIIKMNKPIRLAKLKHGDIVGFHGIAHTCVFDRKVEKTRLWYDGGTAANDTSGHKTRIHRRKRSYGHNVGIILRPRTNVNAKK